MAIDGTLNALKTQPVYYPYSKDIYCSNKTVKLYAKELFLTIYPVLE